MSFKSFDKQAPEHRGEKNNREIDLYLSGYNGKGGHGPMVPMHVIIFMVMFRNNLV